VSIDSFIAAEDCSGLAAADLYRGRYVHRLSVAIRAMEWYKRKVINEIFEASLPPNKTRRRRDGLGLFVVHGIIKSHGGEIVVTSQLGVGSTFSIFLHKRPMWKPCRCPVGRTQCHGQRLRRVLVVGTMKKPSA